jgi:hypothetical protein
MGKNTQLTDTYSIQSIIFYFFVHYFLLLHTNLSNRVSHVHIRDLFYRNHLGYK